MALKKQIKTKYGGYAEYWKIVRFEFDVSSCTGIIYLLPYVSKKSRQANEQGIDSEEVVIRIADVNYDGTGYENLTTMDFTDVFSGKANSVEPQRSFYSVMYEYLKSNTPFFKDAEDI